MAGRDVMMDDRVLTATLMQRLCLLFLRVATGFLLVWGGLRAIVNAQAPFGLTRTLELEAASGAILAYGAGAVQLLLGVLCVIGLARRIVLPVQALIHGFTATSV